MEPQLTKESFWPQGSIRLQPRILETIPALDICTLTIVTSSEFSFSLLKSFPFRVQGGLVKKEGH